MTFPAHEPSLATKYTFAVATQENYQTKGRLNSA